MQVKGLNSSTWNDNPVWSIQTVVVVMMYSPAIRLMLTSNTTFISYFMIKPGQNMKSKIKLTTLWSFVKKKNKKSNIYHNIRRAITIRLKFRLKSFSVKWSFWSYPIKILFFYITTSFRDFKFTTPHQFSSSSRRNNYYSLHLYRISLW